MNTVTDKWKEKTRRLREERRKTLIKEKSSYDILARPLRNSIATYLVAKGIYDLDLANRMEQWFLLEGAEAALPSSAGMALRQLETAFKWASEDKA